MEQLRQWVEEVDDLRQKEEKYGFAEMTKNTDNCERHTRKVAKGVANENTGWISKSKQKTSIRLI